MNLLMGQNQETFLAQTLHYCLGNLLRAENAVQTRCPSIGSTQHGGINRLRAQATDLDPVITVGNRQRLRESNSRMLCRGVCRCKGLRQ